MSDDSHFRRVHHVSLRAFVRAIFEDLAWLGLDWEKPVRVQSEHFPDYDANIGRLWEMGAVYPCSIATLKWSATGVPSSSSMAASATAR